MLSNIEKTANDLTLSHLARLYDSVSVIPDNGFPFAWKPHNNLQILDNGSVFMDREEHFSSLSQ